MTLLPSHPDNNVLPFVEGVAGAGSGLAHLEEGCGGHDELEARLFSNVVTDVEHAVLETDFGRLPDIEDGFKIVVMGGQRTSPDMATRTPEHNLCMSRKLNGSKTKRTNSQLFIRLRGCSLGRAGRSTTTPAERPPFPEAA